MNLKEQVAKINPGDWVRAKFQAVSSNDPPTSPPDAPYIVEADAVAVQMGRLHLGPCDLRYEDGTPGIDLVEVLEHRPKPTPALVESEGDFWERLPNGCYRAIGGHRPAKAWCDLVDPHEAELRVKPLEGAAAFAAVGKFLERRGQ